jgi:PII-like signaling protein
VADAEEKIDRVKAELAMIIKEGLITEERVSIVFVGGKKKPPSNEAGEKP